MAFISVFLGIAKNLLSNPKLLVTIVLLLVVSITAFKINRHVSSLKSDITKLNTENVKIKGENVKIKGDNIRLNNDLMLAIDINSQNEKVLQKLKESYEHDISMLKSLSEKQAQNRKTTDRLLSDVERTVPSEDGAIATVLSNTIHAIQLDRESRK